MSRKDRKKRRGGIGTRKVPGSFLLKQIRQLYQYTDGGFGQMGHSVGIVMEMQAALITFLGRVFPDKDVESELSEIVKVQIAAREAAKKAEENQQGTSPEPVSTPAKDQEMAS